MSDLEVFVPQPRVLRVAGVDITLYPLRVRQLPAVLKALAPIMSDLGGEKGWLDLLADHSERIIEAVAVSSGQSHAWICELSPDELIVIAEGVWEINQDFFARAVLPRLTAALTKAGQIALPALSPTGTG